MITGIDALWAGPYIQCLIIRACKIGRYTVHMPHPITECTARHDRDTGQRISCICDELCLPTFLAVRVTIGDEVSQTRNVFSMLGTKHDSVSRLWWGRWTLKNLVDSYWTAFVDIRVKCTGSPHIWKGFRYLALVPGYKWLLGLI